MVLVALGMVLVVLKVFHKSSYEKAGSGKQKTSALRPQPPRVKNPQGLLETSPGPLAPSPERHVFLGMVLVVPGDLLVVLGV